MAAVAAFIKTSDGGSALVVTYQDEDHPIRRRGRDEGAHQKPRADPLSTLSPAPDDHPVGERKKPR